MPRLSVVDFILLAPLILLIPLSDLYYDGIGRPFDYVALILIVLLAILFNAHMNYGSYVKLAFFWVLCLFLVVPGLFQLNIMANLAFLTGATIIYPYGIWIANRLSPGKLLVLLQTIAIIIMFFIFTQFIIYRVSGYFIDFTTLFGSLKSRGLNIGLNYMRPSGIFQEPNSYATVMLGLIFLLSSLGCNRFIFYLGLLSIFTAQSIWGFGAIIFLFVYREHKILLKYWFAISIVLLVVCLIFYQFLSTLQVSGIMINRLLNIMEDPSVNDRLGFIVGNRDIPFNFLIFGLGIDTVNFQTLGANGFGYLLYSFGFFMSIFFIIMFLHFDFDIWKIGLLLCYLITFPAFSYMYFWVYFGLLAGLKKSNAA